MSLFLRVVAIATLISASTSNAAWHEAKSKHFTIYADLKPGEIRDYAERLERFDQAVRKIQSMDDPPLTDAQHLTIFAMKNEDAVARAVGSDSILGLYGSTAQGSFAFVPAKAGFFAQRSGTTADSVFFHEYAHHLQSSQTSAALPAWFTEGFAEFFGSAEMLAEGSVRIGLPPPGREWSVQKYDGLSIFEMLAGSLRNMSDRETSALYGRGWLLTHMLSFDPARRGQLPRYLNAIQQGVDILQAAKSAFGDDLRSVDRDLDQYLRQSSFKTLIVKGENLATGPIAIRPLRSSEAAIMDVRMRLRLATVGIYRGDGSRRAADARKVARSQPDDPIVQSILAQAELDARNFSAAEAAALRALAVEPKLADAQISVAKAKMEAGRLNPLGTDWKEVRSSLLRANKLDPENAEPLMLFYRTFRYANAEPTPNAIAGLLYAVTLAPRDQDLRIEAVRQLVVDNRLEEARRLFGPIAFYPHSGLEWRAKKTAINDALVKSDRTTALSLIDSELEKRSKERDET